ncbi:hypothetical protein [Granulicella sibirica]|uniref:EfeO-type cupredoxin-like domain-containing protein n=1 Tax=Granulicella sibirica TaxID=2479048 RepID=A0A4Q0T3V5_9BACT|nr:hypothetical protein [Granulicella sibirica]RXH57977.1 hypothetical protein GRAN_1287 [Granulicella sibirica]
MMTKSFKASALKSAVVLATLAVTLAPSAAFASSLHVTPSVHAFFGDKVKTIHFNVRNSSGAPIELKAGDQVMTVAAGQTMELKLPNGTRVINNVKTDKREAGAVICEVSSALNDSTVVLN